MEDSSFFFEYQMNDPLDCSLDQINFQSFPSRENHNPQRSKNNSDSNIKAIHVCTERPVKQVFINGWNSSTVRHVTPKASPSSSCQVISFKNSNSPESIYQQVNKDRKGTMNPNNEAGSCGDIKLLPSISQGSYEEQFCPRKLVQETKKFSLMTRTSLQAADHIIAERNRREKISQGFISLSALIPGRKKMDKASVLEDAFNYLKQLQERVKTLEEKATKSTMGSLIVVKKSRLCADDQISSSDGNFARRYLPEIETRTSDRDVLIRIHCEKNSTVRRTKAV